MIYVVLTLVLLNLALTVGFYRTVKNGTHFTQIDNTSDVPYLQLIAKDLDEVKDFIGDFERQQIERINSNPEPEQQQYTKLDTSGGSGSSAWRNQKNIDPWAPNSTWVGGAPQEPKPMERPSGFSS